MRSVCPSMTTASTRAQVASFATTSRSRRALAACVSSDFMNAKTSSFWKVTAASQRLGAGAGAGGGGGGGAGREQAEDRASDREFQVLQGLLLVVDAPCASLVRATSSTPGIIHHMSGRQRISRGKIARSRARIRWFE